MTEAIISFFVEGEPRAKQSFRSLGHRGGYTPARIKNWQSRIGYSALSQTFRPDMHDALTGNLSVELTFFMGDLRRIDLDNLSKAVLDGLNGIAWKDDKQITHLVINKYVCRENPGVLVKIKRNSRDVELSEERQKHLIGLAPFDLEPDYSEHPVNERLYAEIHPS